MGYFNEISEGLSGKTASRGAKDAAIAQLLSINKAQDRLDEDYPGFADYYRPRAEMGETAFQEYAKSRTPEGFAANMEAIGSGDVYASILKPRMEGAQRQLASTGLSRSSFGARHAADVSQDTMLAIEELLTGRTRDVSNMGYDALGRQVGYEQAYSDASQNYELQRGSVMAGNILGQAQASTNAANNLMNQLHEAGMGVMQMFSMGGGGGANVEREEPDFLDNQSPMNNQQYQQYGGYA